MKKLKEFCLKNKTLLFALLFSLIFLLSATFVLVAQVLDAQYKVKAEYISDNYGQQYIALKHNTVLKQSFDYKKQILKLDTVFKKVGNPQGEITVSLYDGDTNKLLVQEIRDISFIGEGENYNTFSFSNQIADATSGNYVLEILSEFATIDENNALFLSCSQYDAIKNGVLTVDNAKIDGSLAIKASYERVGRFPIIMYLAIVCVLTLLIFTIIFISGKNIKFEILFLIILIAIGTLYGIVLPPYSSPDEMQHINQAYNNSSKMLGVAGDKENRFTIFEDYSTIDSNFKRPSDFNAVIENKDTNVFTYKEFADNFFVLSKDAASSSKEFSGEEVGGYNYLYLFSSIGVFIARILNLGFVHALILGRLLNFAVYVVACYFAVKLIPFGKSILATVALLPMTLHVANSFNRDSIILSLTFIFIAYCLHLTYCENIKQIKIKHLVFLSIIGMMIVPAKIVYIPLVLLVAIIPKCKFNSLQNSIISKIIVCAVSFLPYIIYTTVIYIISQIRFKIYDDFIVELEQTGQLVGDVAQQVEQYLYVPPDSITFNLSYILQNPVVTLRLIINTIVQEFSYYFETMIGGKLSYFTVQIDWIFVLAFTVVLILAVLTAQKTNKMLAVPRTMGITLSVAIIGLVVLGCILWTPTYYTTIYGIQGRYFLPVIPLLLVCIQPKELGLNKDISKLLLLSTAVIQGYTVLNIFTEIISK